MKMISLKSLHYVLLKRVSSFFNSSMRKLIAKKRLILLTITLKYTVKIHLPFKSLIFSGMLVSQKQTGTLLQSRVCSVRTVKDQLMLYFFCIFPLFKVGIFYKKLILRKRDFKFSSTKNLFHLFKTKERDYLSNLFNRYSCTNHLMSYIFTKSICRCHLF